MHELIPIISRSKNDQTTNPVEPKQKSSILDKFPKSLKHIPGYIKEHPAKAAVIITATTVAVAGLATAAIFTGGGALAVAGAVGAGLIGSGAFGSRIKDARQRCRTESTDWKN